MLLLKEQKMSLIILYLCIRFRKQVDLFFPTLEMIHVNVQRLEKDVLHILPIRQILVLAKNPRRQLVHKVIMGGAAEQIPVDMNGSLSMDLDSSPSINQKKHMEIKQLVLTSTIVFTVPVH